MNSTTSLRDFVSHARESGRIRFADLRRLQRDILPARITTCEEAELLIALDRAVRTADRDWSDYLVVTVRDFVIWGIPPVGAVDHDKAEWLVRALSSGGVTKAGLRIAREVAREASQVDDALIAFTGGLKRRASIVDQKPEPTPVPNDHLPAITTLLAGYERSAPGNVPMPFASISSTRLRLNFCALDQLSCPLVPGGRGEGPLSTSAGWTSRALNW